MCIRTNDAFARNTRIREDFEGIHNAVRSSCTPPARTCPGGLGPQRWSLVLLGWTQGTLQPSMFSVLAQDEQSTHWPEGSPLISLFCFAFQKENNAAAVTLIVTQRIPSPETQTRPVHEWPQPFLRHHCIAIMSAFSFSTSQATGASGGVLLSRGVEHAMADSVAGEIARCQGRES